ncbi:MAG: helix-turn-helix transcriptional regulator [Gemmataceae bacterium]|nr:helix-turn-helix transcriptional regulator [Gemmataceae bacterium]
MPESLPQDCPLRQLFDLIGDRWTSIVVFVIADQVLRYSDLQRRIPGVSKKMLTQTLRTLERDGLVARKVYAVVPPRTEYRLTKLGLEVLEPIKLLSAWADENKQSLNRIFDRRRKNATRRTESD